MNELKLLETRQVLDREFTIYGTAEDPLFLAKDVAEIIEHSNVTKMLISVDEDEVVKIRPNKSLGLLTSNNTYNFLTEDGLYEVMMTSNKPIAKAFKKEVKNILKTIRKHGIYATDVTIDNILADPDFGITLLTNLKDERKKNLILEQQVKEYEPKATYYDQILSSKGAITITIIAKDYGMSAIALNKILHDLKIQYKQSGTWLLYSKYQDKGYTKTQTYKDNTGVSRVSTKWTQKGRLFLYQELKSINILPVIEQEEGGD